MFDFLKGPLSKREKIFSVIIFIVAVVSTILWLNIWDIWNDKQVELTKEVNKTREYAVKNISEAEEKERETAGYLEECENNLSFCQEATTQLRKDLDECNASNTELITQRDRAQKALENCNSIYGK